MLKYKFIMVVVRIFNKIYVRPTYEGLENIPESGSFVVAGNHIHLYDPITIKSIIKRDVHFLGKASLFKFPQSLIFNNTGTIKVNRDGNDREAYDSAIDYLKKGEIIGIYPEGTRERGRGLLPFKTGAVRMSLDADTVIIPFATIGEYRPFKKGLIVRFGKPYKASEDIQKSNEELRNIIKELLER